MASMRDIKRRKESVQSTQQITKAMKLVATVKLQKARGKAESNKPYFNMLYDTICSILSMTKNVNHKFLQESDCKKKAVIAVTSNRGLAGGYNSNIVKAILAAEDLIGSNNNSLISIALEFNPPIEFVTDLIILF